MPPTSRVKRRLWAFLVYNAIIAAWALGGHWGVDGSGGEGKVLVAVTIIVFWVLGNLLFVTVWLVAGRWHKRET